jgi:hypothetical protein
MSKILLANNRGSRKPVDRVGIIFIKVFIAF